MYLHNTDILVYILAYILTYIRRPSLTMIDHQNASDLIEIYF